MEENADDREDGNYCRERGKVQGKEKKGVMWLHVKKENNEK